MQTVIDMDGSYECDALRRARRGDAVAFAALVRGHQRLVYSLALRMLCDRHEAEDVAQEAFLQLHRHLAVIQSAAHLLFWLRKVTTHLAIDRLRQAPRHEVLPLSAGSEVTTESSEDPLLQRQMRALVAALPPDPRAVVLLRYQEDLDPTEIAEVLDMSINTVKSHLRRSLTVLRTQLQDVCTDTTGAASALAVVSDHDAGRES
jgi:RNA polymerase sigma-70 factor (ECF subfamily)